MPCVVFKVRDCYECFVYKYTHRAVTKALIGGGGCIFIYLRSARRISFEISCHYSCCSVGQNAYI